MASRDSQVRNILGSAAFQLPDTDGSVQAGTGNASDNPPASAHGDNGTGAANPVGDKADAGRAPRAVDPANTTTAPSSTDNGATATRAKRTRSSGASPRSASNKRNPQATENLEKLLFSVHLMLAAKMEVVEVAITTSQAHEIAQAVADVAALSKKTAWLSDEAAAWINLSIALGGTYIPMGMALLKRSQDTEPINVGAGQIIPPSQ